MYNYLLLVFWQWISSRPVLEYIKNAFEPIQLGTIDMQISKISHRNLF